MYNMNQVADMDRNTLVAVINDAEQCVLHVQNVLDARKGFQDQKAGLLNQCAQIQKKIKWFPFMPWMAVLVILALFNNWFLLVLIAAIAGGFIYKAKKKHVWEMQIETIQNQQIPAVDMKIRQCGDNLNSLGPWTMSVKTLFSLLPENLRNLESLRDQLLQGAPNWYTAVQGYQSALQREEQARQMREMQANVQQVAADSRRTAAAVDDVRRQTQDIARNTARTAQAAENSAYHAARTAAAAQESAKANRQSAKANERRAKAAERQAAAAEDASYYIKDALNRW